ncbi:MAG: PQQ-binding-like beta-propeller repeat protein [Armatimonadota bacterium]|nr:PQQ-binding-like beta-propeller repeat protein [Armatimonadota bacterium]
MRFSKTVYRRFLLLLTVGLGICPTGVGASVFWQHEQSVKAARLLPDGAPVYCEAVTVQRIAARNNPAYFVIQDPLRPASRIVVLGRAPLALRSGHTVDVRGVLGTTNGERCIVNPTVRGYFDAQGRLTWFPPLLGVLSETTRQDLPLPTSPTPPSDPSLPADGLGVTGDVTAAPPLTPAKFDTVAELLAAQPALLTRAQLSGKPVKEVGEGYIVIGDDNADSTVKIYTTDEAKPGDRIVSVKGCIHSENGGPVIYAESGPHPYFDVQAAHGSVLTAKPGTVAYAATLGDAVAASTGGAGIMSVGGDTANGKWVYLTGQVVSSVDRYWSYDLNPDAWVDVCYLQPLDHTGGFRAYLPATAEWSAGAVVDVMAKLDTKDGQRLLGVIGQNGSIEYKTLHSADGSTPSAVRALGMNNTQVGGKKQGDNPGNPGVTGATGLYNVGSYATVWGRVLEYGNYPFDGNNSTYYMRVDDGAGVASGGYGGAKGVIVFAAQWLIPQGLQVGDYVMATGVSGVWKPSGSSTTYRAIWSADSIYKVEDGATRTVLTTGDISGVVKLYDMPASTAKAHIWLSSGKATTLTVNRGPDNSGSAAFTLSDVPKRIHFHSPTQDYDQDISYAISAQCQGYKTRTYANVAPDTTRNLYLVRLRKLYLSSNSYTIDAYPNSAPATITAQVMAVNAQGDKVGVSGVTVRFITDTGSFSQSSQVTSYSATTNSQGVATAQAYGATSTQDLFQVFATDDSAPLPEDDLTDDPGMESDHYMYDWEQLPQRIFLVWGNMTLTASPTSMHPCGADNRSTITATVKRNDGQTAVVGANVRFTTDRGVFEESGNSFASLTTNSTGVAVVHLLGTGLGGGTATVTAYCYGSGPCVTRTVSVSVIDDKLALTPAYYSVPPTQTTGQLTGTVTTSTGTPIQGRTVTFSTPPPGSLNPTSGVTGSDGTVTTVLSGVSQGGFAVVQAVSADSCGQSMAQKLQIDFLQSANDDWPQFMHDSRHQGYSRTNDTTTSESLTLAWSAALPTADTEHAAGGWQTAFGQPHPTGGAASSIFPHPYIDSSPVHAAGCPVIVGAWASGNYWQSTGYLAAFNPTTGANAWRYPTTGFIGGVASTPCVADIAGTKYTYIGSMDGKLYCLNAQTGSLAWSYQTLNRSGGPGRILASPTVYSGRVYIGNESAGMYCLDAATGELKWSYDLPPDGAWPDMTGLSSPAVAAVSGEAKVYVGCDNGYVYCLSTADSPPNRKLWEYYAGACVESSPMVYADKVYVGTSWYNPTGTAYQFIALDAITGDFRWAQDLSQEARATCAASDSHLYTGVDTGHIFHKRRASDGGQAGWFDGGNYFVGSAALAPSPADLIYIGNDNGNFYALRQSSLTSPLATHSTGGYVCSSPAVSYATETNSRWVYVVSRGDDGRADGNGTLYAFRTQR